VAQSSSAKAPGQPQAAEQAPPLQKGLGTSPEAIAPVQSVDGQAQDGSAAVKEMQQALHELNKFLVPMKQDVSADAEALQSSLKNQHTAMESVHSSLARAAGEQNQATQRAANLSSRIQMGNNLENFYYCQIPFEIAQRQQTAELYVFERKRKAGEDGERTNTTILIALETQHMGRVESVMRAEQDELSIEFRVENDAVLKYLHDAGGELRKELQNSDFAVREIKVTRIEVPATPLNADQLVGEKEQFMLQAIDISV
ncbi:MAG TPA: hypothetical protein DEB31_10135, partial [Clostridiales bacterium]|nr:hypothetical protein [Clostridiales bacterium]